MPEVLIAIGIYGNIYTYLTCAVNDFRVYILLHKNKYRQNVISATTTLNLWNQPASVLFNPFLVLIFLCGSWDNVIQ